MTKPFTRFLIFLSGGFLLLSCTVYERGSGGSGMAPVGDNGTFSTYSFVTTRIGDNTSSIANALSLQPDGGLLAAGSTFLGSGEYDVALVRYLPNDSLDTGLNGTGIVTTNFGAADDGRALAVQSDGKIVVAGSTGPFSGSSDYAIARYNANGSLDTTFNGTGRVTTNLSTYDYGTAAVIDGSGRLVVAGHSTGGPLKYDFSLVRYLSSGALDTSFNGTGIVTTPIGSNNAFCGDLALQSDGKLVLVGKSGFPVVLTLVRYNTNGSLDTSFNGTGIVTVAPFTGGSSLGAGSAVAIQSDGKIVAAGSSLNGDGDYDFALARFNANGTPDTTFNGTGRVTTPVGAGNDQINRLAIQSDGKIVAVGSSHNGSNYDIAVARYDATGALDTSFLDQGTVSTDIASDDDRAYSVVIDNAGDILVAGYTRSGGQIKIVLVRYFN